MNELYFNVKGSDWKAGRPSAYYLDNICEFLSTNADFEQRENFIHDFLKPLNALYREKYKMITKSSATTAEKFFIVEIPLDIFSSGSPALEWYVRQYPDGEYIDTAKDFLSALREAEKKNSLIIITGE